LENNLLGKTKADPSSSLAPRVPQALELLGKHPKITESVEIIRNKVKLLTPGIGIACHYLFSKKDKTMADAFFTALATGEGLKKTQAVYKLREFLIQNKVAKRKASTTEVAAITIKAWNPSRNGDNVSVLR